MKKQNLLVTVVMFMTLLACLASPASALVFSDTVDFGPGESFTTINDSDSLALRSWTHNILDNIAGNPITGITITSTSLAFRYNRTNGTGESWSLNQALGALTLAGTSNVTSDHSFGLAALADLSADGLITLTVSESGASAHNFRAFDAILSGEYTVNPTNPNGAPSIPEPLTLLTITSGLGLSALLRNRRIGTR